MAADQATALLIIGSIAIFYWIIRDLPTTLNPAKPVGYLIVGSLLLSALHVANKTTLGVTGDIQDAVELYFTTYFWIFIGLVFTILGFYLKEMLFYIKDSTARGYKNMLRGNNGK